MPGIGKRAGRCLGVVLYAGMLIMSALSDNSVVSAEYCGDREADGKKEVQAEVTSRQEEDKRFSIGAKEFTYIPGAVEEDTAYISGAAGEVTNDLVFHDTKEILELGENDTGIRVEDVAQCTKQEQLAKIWIVEMATDSWLPAEEYITENTLEYPVEEEGSYLLLGEKEDGGYVNLKKYSAVIREL